MRERDLSSGFTPQMVSLARDGPGCFLSHVGTGVILHCFSGSEMEQPELKPASSWVAGTKLAVSHTYLLNAYF